MRERMEEGQKGSREKRKMGKFREKERVSANQRNLERNTTEPPLYWCSLMISQNALHTDFIKTITWLGLCYSIFNIRWSAK